MEIRASNRNIKMVASNSLLSLLAVFPLCISAYMYAHGDSSTLESRYSSERCRPELQSRFFDCENEKRQQRLEATHEARRSQICQRKKSSLREETQLCKLSPFPMKLASRSERGDPNMPFSCSMRAGNVRTPTKPKVIRNLFDFSSAQFCKRPKEAQMPKEIIQMFRTPTFTSGPIDVSPVSKQSIEEPCSELCFPIKIVPLPQTNPILEQYPRLAPYYRTLHPLAPQIQPVGPSPTTNNVVIGSGNRVVGKNNQVSSSPAG